MTTTKAKDLSDESILSSFDPVLEVGTSFKNSTPEQELSEEIATQFDLKKELQKIPQKIYFRIGEVAELLKLKTYVLRFWETEFPMVAPKKSKTGQRVYQRRDVELLFLIKHLLYVERFSIEGARKRIRELKREGELKPGLKTGLKKNFADAPAPIQADLERLQNAKAELLKLEASKSELRRKFEELESLLRVRIENLFHY